ncbi:MFS transporter [Metabacillus rhizolycopersici]|uniref:MFS transporter n=1 Tax=Metabacillus rhizolycopersici TaxID=2875709 RepID=A0ABS7UY52_9BACI|nr:MFS transporter [Metabacillus rhizolycopersici]MBZ5752967.1 MFS transporter [Metabacillus rhizolycopersici]
MRWVILAFAFFGTVLNFADKSVAGYAAIPIMEEFNLNFTQWGLVGSSFFWFFAIAGVLGASLSDRLGAKKIMAIMVISWTIIQSGSYLVTGLTGLILMRVLLGIFEGPYFATAANLITKWFPPERRGIAIALMNSGGTIGGLVMAPVLVSTISEVGWRHTYGGLGLIGIVWFVLWLWIGKENPKQETLISGGTKSAPKISWSKIYPVLLSRNFLLVCLAVFASYWFLGWMQAFLAAYFVQAIQLTPKEMGNYASIIGISSAILTLLFAWYSDSLYKKNQSIRKSRVFVGGGAVTLAGLLFYSITIIHDPIYVLFVMCVGKALAYVMFVLWPAIATNLLPERGGLILGIGTGFAQLAGIIGPIVSGALVQSTGNNVVLGFDYSILFIGTLMVVFGITFLLFCKPDKQVGNMVNLGKNESVS